MGRYVFRLPDIGEGIAEAEIVAWHVNVGDRVEEDGRLADMMTGKATVEMESPVAGTVLELAGEVGDNVAIGAPLVVLEVEGEGEDSERPSTGSGRADVVSVEPAEVAALRPEAQKLPARPEPVEACPERLLPAASRRGRAPTPGPNAKVLASPAVRARASALGIDLASIHPSGDGLIRHAELDAFLASRPQAKPPAEERPPELLTGAGEQVKVIGLRRRIAEAMAASKRHIPHFSYVEECDVTALEDLRGELNAISAERPRLTLLPLLISAVCRALPDFPMINARFDDEAGVVTRYRSVHLGIATQTQAGLMVPVIRDAQDLGLWELASEIARLAQAARDGTARAEELTGSTLTVTSLGALGGIAATPVINRPEVAIIGPNRIVERPMFVPDGQGGERVEKRKLMNISISCDHRVVDGWDAASFVQAVRTLLESPLRLLAQ